MHDHPLMLACSEAFTPRMALMDGLMVEAEDVFCVVAEVMDSVLSEEQPTQVFVSSLWTNLIINIRRQWQSDASEKDRMLVATAVFYIVRETLGHHCCSRYCDTLYDLLTTAVEEKCTMVDQDEEQAFFHSLDQCAEGLSEWINQYTVSEVLLTDLIMAALTDSHPLVPKAKSGRKAKDVKSIVQTFDYQPQRSDRGQRLQAFYNSLKGRYIDMGTNQKDFIDLFQNTTTPAKVIWIQEIVLLKYLVLQIEKFLTIPDGFTKWQIVCAHFQVRVRHKECVDNKTVGGYETVDLETSQFSKGAKLHGSNVTLDKIARILDPETDFGEVLQDYLDFQQEHDERKDTADALANGLNTDIRV